MLGVVLQRSHVAGRFDHLNVLWVHDHLGIVSRIGVANDHCGGVLAVLLMRVVHFDGRGRPCNGTAAAAAAAAVATATATTTIATTTVEAAERDAYSTSKDEKK
ncbi:1-aminocyclopropane-1-carboxylate synthase [Trichinella spiralis]|uniref:1-aminocyclopropane-1-carboxylate synthase n=1 Tax=Trichinella spiralis TaxID=6334 RepID=UPI0001EFD10A|nr:1-aminocyclopropane-1-carboxylate synthase [Trichinella spiralis]